MVAVAQYIPDDPQQKASVLAVLREHPELQGFIARASAKAEELFPETRITLDAVQYDEWDPPVRMIVKITQPWPDYQAASDTFIHWVGHLPDYKRDLILVMPMWNGPIETLQQ